MQVQSQNFNLTEARLLTWHGAGLFWENQGVV